MATTTNYSWTTPDNTAYVKDGASAIRTLGTSVDTTLFTALGGAYPGLRLVKKQTIGTGVSSVAVTSAFSATYENYLIVISGGVASGQTVLNTILGATVAGYYGSYINGSYTSTTVANANDNNSARWLYTGFADTNNIQGYNVIGAPFLTKNTTIKGTYVATGTTASSGTYAGYLNNSLSYTDFTITANTGGVTLTGGTIYVYGYGAS